MAKSKPRSQRQQQAPQQHCIFCQGHGMTKQHLWPDWMGRDPALPTYRREGPQYYNTRRLSSSFTVVTEQPNMVHSLFPLPKNKAHKGHIGSQKLRKVCQACNTGWLHKIEQESQKEIRNLILGNFETLSVAEQTKIAVWGTQMAIINEFDDPMSRAVTYSERKYFMETRLPPLGWRIFIDRYQGTEYVQDYHHRSFGTHFSYDDSPQLPLNPKAEIQVSRFIAGKLMLYVISTNKPEHQDKVDAFTHQKLAQLWPSTNAEIDLSAMAAISDEEVVKLVETARYIIHSDYADYIPPSPWRRN
jgi:hypothetical protein